MTIINQALLALLDSPSLLFFPPLCLSSALARLAVPLLLLLLCVYIFSSLIIVFKRSHSLRGGKEASRAEKVSTELNCCCLDTFCYFVWSKYNFLVARRKKMKFAFLRSLKNQLIFHST